MIQILIKFLVIVSIVNATQQQHADNVKHVPKPHALSDGQQHQKQQQQVDRERRTVGNFVSFMNVPQSESDIEQVVDFKDSKISPPLMIWPETLISKQTNHSRFNYFKVSPKDDDVGYETRKFIEYYNRDDEVIDEQHQRQPKILIENNPQYFYSIEKEIPNDDSSNQQHQQPEAEFQLPIIVESGDDSKQQKDFTSVTSDFLNIDSKTIHIIPNDKSTTNSRPPQQDSPKMIRDESFLNTHERENYDKSHSTSASTSGGTRSVISENFLTPVHVGIVLMNENEVANNDHQKQKQQQHHQQQHLKQKPNFPTSATTTTKDEFMPAVDTRKNVKKENDFFVPSELVSQTPLQTMVMGMPVNVENDNNNKFVKRPSNFADNVKITNNPKKVYKPSPAMSFLNDLFNFDDIINLLTGKKSPQQNNNYSNYHKLAPSSSNINAIKKPLHTKYFPSTTTSVRTARKPKYITINEYQQQHQQQQDYAKYSDQISAASIQGPIRSVNSYEDPHLRYSPQFPNDNYIGPTPNSEDYWANNGVSFNDGIKFRRNVENGRSLRIEYGGFLPKISPSLEIDQNGAPLNKISLTS